MKFSESWLREWVNPKIDTEQLASQLTMAGLEVDGIHPAAESFTGVVVGHVLKAEQHPDADRLRVCTVHVGEQELLTIVCGGVNVRENLKVAVAKVGAVLPGDFKIQAAKLRGVPSAGMICSANELGMSEEGAVKHGIMELPEDAPVGVALETYLQLDDKIIAIDLTPNRGDCLSIRGLAREIALFNSVEIQGPKITAIQTKIKTSCQVRLNTNACPHYIGRVIRKINSNAITPLWMQERLRRGGVRSIHPVVDVCNYVMLELGQPMHGFDLAKLKGDIVVREAAAGEKIVLLDDQEVILHEGTTIIADEEQPLAIAGIMGGKYAGVSRATTDIFLESAFFNPVNICLDARRYNIQSDSSHRFERGVDYQLQVSAIERATALLLEIMGGEAEELIIAKNHQEVPSEVKVHLQRKNIARLLGMTFADADVVRLLTALGMRLSSVDEGWEVRVPSHRFDITLEADLIEELARVNGYDNIPLIPMEVNLEMPAISECELPRDRIARFLIDQGYYEAITYSFVDKEIQALINPDQEPIVVANPIAADMTVMRTSIWPGLLNALIYNENRQCARVRLFETGLCFTQRFTEQGNEWLQTPKLAMLASGLVQPQQWGFNGSQKEIDFFDLKGDVEALLSLVKKNRDIIWEKGEHPALHPGQTAKLFEKGQCIGYLGALHPKIAQHMQLNHVPCLFEIDLVALDRIHLPTFSSISKFPAVKRDLALVVDQEVTAAKIIAVVTESAGYLLSNTHVFDVYQGEGIPSGKKSVALGLTFQDPARTLRDDEINEVIRGIVSGLAGKLHATLRA